MTVKDIFDAGAGSYDALRRKVIPCFDEFYDNLLELVPFYSLGPLAVLDLGAGTGLVTALILDRFPRAAVTLVDISEQMLSKARERFRGNPRVRFTVMDYAVSGFGGRYDLVVSAMSIHHLSNPQKQALFPKIFDSLVPAGGFVHAELVRGDTEHTEAICRERWLEHLHGTDLTDEQLSAILERMSYDRTATLEAQLGWLRDAGFQDVDCFYKQYNFAVYAGKRPGGDSNVP